jgi:murein DD-endopeptidase MepM/ murein hydrolase activator NlpD
MANVRYKYNPHTCRYEPYQVSGKVLWKKVSLFFSLASMIACLGYYATIQYFDSFEEMVLQEKNQKLKITWNMMNKRIKRAQTQLQELIVKDDENYRVILDSSPLEPSIREAGFGGSERPNMVAAKDFPYIVSDYQLLDKLEHKVDVEIQSYNELQKILNGKIISWAARPAIQPINNTQLERLHLTYGSRFHPIFKVWKEHKGLDFAAADGTPVYATGDGEVANVYFSDSYGKVIYIDHGYGFETRYAHLSNFAVMIGEPVKRGQLIGYVGNTGHSVSAHLHYEVLYQGDHVNPINFFQRDLNNDEYEKLIEAGTKNDLSLD